VTLAAFASPVEFCCLLTAFDMLRAQPSKARSQ